ncbi:MAG: membrane fusion protein (multidrug efflux system) [Sulfitobacter sp.]|jgi:membrane fusion protein, multidrug efflux system
MRNFKLIGLGAVVLVMGAGLYWWWENGRIYPSTDDAYLQANIVTIAPQVGGRVHSVAAQENLLVSAGDVLFQLDTTALQAAVETAQAQFDQATQNAGASGENVAAAQAELSSAMAAAAQAQTTFERDDRLFKLGDLSKAALDQSTAARDQATAATQAAQAALSAAKAQLGQTGQQNAGVRAALGQLTQARLNLDHAVVTAPVDGWIANISLRPGQVVAAGQPMFSLVESGLWWIEGNFKETDLARIRPGQPVSVAVDMYPGLALNGEIVSLGAGSGAVFSLLPPQNATGNWVKVTQRFAVRISVAKVPTDPALQLRVGASVAATVDTSGLDHK